MTQKVTSLRRAHAEEGLGGEHERPQVEALLPARRPGTQACVDRDELAQRLDEVVRRAARAAPAGGPSAANRAALASGRKAQIEPSACR